MHHGEVIILKIKQLLSSCTIQQNILKVSYGIPYYDLFCLPDQSTWFIKEDSASEIFSSLKKYILVKICLLQDTFQFRIWKGGGKIIVVKIVIFNKYCN